MLIPIWVGFPNLPVNLYNDDYLWCIAGNFGEVLRIHDSTLAWTQTAEALICVDVDIAKPLVDRIWVGQGDKGYWQSVNCHRVQPICSFCGRLGHSPEACKKKSRDNAQTHALQNPKVTTLPVKEKLNDQEWSLVKHKGAATKDDLPQQTSLVLPGVSSDSNHLGVPDATMHQSKDVSMQESLLLSPVVELGSHDSQLLAPLPVHGDVHARPVGDRSGLSSRGAMVVLPEAAPTFLLALPSPGRDVHGFSDKHLSRGPSNHAPLLMNLVNESPKASRFLIQKMWLNHESLNHSVSDVWNKVDASSPNPFEVLKIKLKAVKNMLTSWNKNVFGKVEDIVCQAETQVEAMQSQFDTNPSAENKFNLNGGTATIRRVLNCQEVFWAQKARIQWLNDGDKNIAFYHAVVQGNRRRNYIHRLNVGTTFSYKGSVDTTISGVDTMAQSKDRNVKKRSTSVDTSPGQVDTRDRSQRNMLTGFYLMSTQNQIVSTLESLPRRPVFHMAKAGRHEMISGRH
ncbi:hypothetical protein Taro_037316 [Colocasia esculenta]|uniref:DUF4283 domain-containing protein n=1 Tax=Colocasia esculenta TaxID=4460 RepID=A0A843WIW1_COLES|nr:hypothetical protein [Colocasia esculenta]